MTHRALAALFVAQLALAAPALAAPTTPTPASSFVATAPKPLVAAATARIDAARHHIDDLKVAWEHGTARSDELLEANRRLMLAWREAPATPAALLKAAQTYRDDTAARVDLLKSKYKMGLVAQTDVDGGEAALAEADFWLAEAQLRAQSR